jgi:hypothetical protein
MSILVTTIDRALAAGGPVDGYYVILDAPHPIFVTAGDANIIRLDIPFEPSGQWRATSIHNSRGKRLSDWHTFAQQYADMDLPTTFKNGKPMYLIGDLDHGTSRVQSDGILRIQRAKIARQADGRWNFAH